MNGLSLFSGAGIGELALKHILPDYRTVGYVDNDKYCQAVLRARIKDGVLDDAPIFGDIREFNTRYASLYTGKVDWLSAGFPCQPFSVAGRQLGEADERNMWPATRDAISIIRPGYVFLENVPGLLVHEYIRQIFGDLAKMRYDCEWDIVAAAFVGAPHLRKRVWILAYAVNERLQKCSRRSGNEGTCRNGENRETSTHNISTAPESSSLADTRYRGGRSVGIAGEGDHPQAKRSSGADQVDGSSEQSETVADAECLRQQQPEGSKQTQRRRIGDGGQSESGNSGWWSVEPELCGIFNGMEL
ncbi:MAG TPA: hypothetical protein ENI27_06770 [bacterium]|nr:hypothetical protein [bacterium]